MLIQKMKYMKNLTTQEKSNVDYILKQPGMVFEVTAQELARLTYTSSSTVVRLCKKLGVKGYPDFHLKMALDYPQRVKKERMSRQGRVEAGMEAKLCDEAIIVGMDGERMRLSKITGTISVQYIFDVLYMSTLTNEGQKPGRSWHSILQIFLQSIQHCTLIDQFLFAAAE